MTAPQDLDASPVTTDGLRGLVRRHAGLLAASAVALAWVPLARRHPDTTYHFAPIIVAASWGAARRWVAAGPGTRTAGLAAACGGATIALTTTAELAWVGALEGPTLWGTSSALVETIAFAAVGAALGFRFVTRRGPGLLFPA